MSMTLFCARVLDVLAIILETFGHHFGGLWHPLDTTFHPFGPKLEKPQNYNTSGLMLAIPLRP